MLTVVYDSLLAAAADLDAAVDDVGWLAAGSDDLGGPSELGELGGEVAAAWASCADAWRTGVAELAATQHHLADGLRRVADLACTADRDAAHVIARVLG